MSDHLLYFFFMAVTMFVPALTHIVNNPSTKRSSEDDPYPTNVSIILNLFTSTRPISVIFSSGITGRARKDI